MNVTAELMVSAEMMVTIVANNQIIKTYAWRYGITLFPICNLLATQTLVSPLVWWLRPYDSMTTAAHRKRGGAWPHFCE